MDNTVRAGIDSYVRRFRQSLAALPAGVRDDYVDAVRSRLEAEYASGKLEQEEDGSTEEEFTAQFLALLKAAPPFILTGLISRGGLSNWVFFFLANEIVMLDLGIAPAIKAGARAGFSAQSWFAVLDGLIPRRTGPQPGRDEALDAWQAKLQSRAKQVRTLRYDRIRQVHLRLRALAHQIIIEDIGTSETRYQLMNRDEAEILIEPLAQRFGSRFQVSSTPVFAICKRYAPFLME